MDEQVPEFGFIEVMLMLCFAPIIISVLACTAILWAPFLFFKQCAEDKARMEREEAERRRIWK